MSMEPPEAGKSYLWFTAAGLGLYCILLTVVTGDIGFNGDDWWVLACPYWHSFWSALLFYAHKFQRPVEGLYWITLFKLFGFNKVVFHLCSLLMLAGSAILMGVALDRAFPRRRTFVSISVLLAFFLPPVSCLTYVMFTDNSRLSMLLFWGFVIALQGWAKKSPTWRGLALPIALYLGSFLTYEAPSFLIFVVPLLVWPLRRPAASRPHDKSFLIKLCVGILSGFITAVAVRFVFLQGGAVAHNHLLPPIELLWSYLALLPFYLLSPLTSMSADRWALLMGFLVVLGSGALFLRSGGGRPVMEPASNRRFEPGSQSYLIVLGVGILVLGMLPYQLAGYGSFAPRLLDTLTVKCGFQPGGDVSWYNFTWASRIYSSASFGVAILLALGLSLWRRSSARIFGTTVTLAVIGFMAVFHAGLSLDWREAAEIRNDLMRSLVSQVPAVKSGANFVFLDIACAHKRAEVIRKENGLRELIGMLYSDQTVGAWRLDAQAYDPCSRLYQQAVAKPEGFLSVGQRQSEPAPPESLLLFKRSGRELVLLDRISSQDGSVPAGIAWRGVEHLASNLDQIEGSRIAIAPEPRSALNAWTSGLISTLQLTRLKSTLAYLRNSRNRVAYEARRRLFKMRMHRVKARL